ncbi:hypothetical protein Ddye_015228, partial [Dipteronia dyeriana]
YTLIPAYSFKWREHHVSWTTYFSLEKEISDRYLNVILKGNKDGLKKLQLRIEDPPREKHMLYHGGAVLAGIMKDELSFGLTEKIIWKDWLV